MKTEQISSVEVKLMEDEGEDRITVTVRVFVDEDTVGFSVKTEMYGPVITEEEVFIGHAQARIIANYILSATQP